MTDNPSLPAAGLTRRLFAAVYDGLLIIALMAVGSLPVIILVSGSAIEPGNRAYQLMLIGISLLFYTGFWMRDGQTLGMRAWRLRLVSVDGNPLTLPQVLLRYGAAWVSLAAGGLGFLWILADPKKMAWHDHWSGSRIIVLPGKNK